jgi:hypothetical protein
MMAAHRPQYHHYIPRFILKKFAFTTIEKEKQDLQVLSTGII